MSGWVYGDGPVAAAVREASGLAPTQDPDAVVAGPVVLALDETDSVDSALTGLLERGIDVISTAHTELSAAALRDSCLRGGATYHQVGLLEFITSRTVPTMVQGMRAVRAIRLLERRDRPSSSESELDRLQSRRVEAVRRAALDLTGTEPQVQVDRSDHAMVIEASIGDRPVYRLVSHFDPSTDTHGFFPTPGGSVSFAVDADSDPGDLSWQTDLPDEAAVLGALAALVVDALPFVRDAGPGILVEDPAPRYQPDTRIARSAT